MRQFVLIAAIILTSASASAEGPRGLLAANETQAADQPNTKSSTAIDAPAADATKAETPAAAPPNAEISASDGYRRPRYGKFGMSKGDAPQAAELPAARDCALPRPKDDWTRRDRAKSFSGDKSFADRKSFGDDESFPDDRPYYSRTDRPWHTRSSLEARVIGELHRHGIYW